MSIEKPSEKKLYNTHLIWNVLCTDGYWQLVSSQLFWSLTAISDYVIKICRAVERNIWVTFFSVTSEGTTSDRVVNMQGTGAGTQYGGGSGVCAVSCKASSNASLLLTTEGNRIPERKRIWSVKLNLKRRIFINYFLKYKICQKNP